MGNFLSVDNGTDCNRTFMVGDRKCGWIPQRKEIQTATQKSRIESWLLPYDCYGPRVSLFGAIAQIGMVRRKHWRVWIIMSHVKTVTTKIVTIFRMLGGSRKWIKNSYQCTFSPSLCVDFHCRIAKIKNIFYWHFFFLSCWLKCYGFSGAKKDIAA